jgi:hypothetical protein
MGIARPSTIDRPVRTPTHRQPAAAPSTNPIDDKPDDGGAAPATPVSVVGATLRALGLLAIALILILVVLPVAIVAAGT